MGNAIYEGTVEVSPFVEGQTSSCDYCPYKAICGFDRKIEGYQERKPRKLDKREILERMESDNAISRAKGNCHEVD